MKNLIKINCLQKLEQTYFPGGVVQPIREIPAFCVENDLIYFYPNSQYLRSIDRGEILIIDNVYEHNEFIIFICALQTFKRVALIFLDEESVKKNLKSQEEFEQLKLTQNV